MSKKEIERLERKLNGIRERENYLIAFYMVLLVIVGCMSVLIIINQPQGTWECVEWEEINVVKEFNMVIHTCKFKTMSDFNETGINACKKSLDELLERKPEFEIMAKQIGDPPEPRRICIKEQLVREVKV